MDKFGLRYNFPTNPVNMSSKLLFYSQALVCNILIDWASIWLALKPFLKFNIDSI